MAYDKPISEKMERFCQYYGQLSDTYNNGVWSHALGYGHDLENASKEDAEVDEKTGKIIKHSTYDLLYHMCGVEAHKLLRDQRIIDRIQEIKATHIEKDLIVDARLMDIIQMGKDTDSLAAIKHRNELKKRVKPQVEITVIEKILKQYGLGGEDVGKAEETES